ncbi:hypothetical protein A3H65_01910 [Candidatus Giovannonibacteria bacterium RIFCSPLOWO2_02_FULL_45_14]|uniref:Uncharacterized protein n=1 Tax=Candidatus Giovannonibacteria bacterium RIFCSPLOWO2_12_FULL_44_15 TaxID=1798364 RepID=A0A1F5XZG5_9BACT|nr:MAG: hypothetical protein A3C75_02760 [Candidatus Giovannonibacteria bacterium RIFCSPHIGHO2_02_FULL_44_31]OGF76335.1 MAG: hypothetical protein A3E62_03615 [Candidatus Giovannonibacteria bacterium RIFCSPHIGHO2_12_FULL_44_29]OGF91278.1 MAG: hypothetical protein A3H65_01910 [Candidatus Giovannonibacteria bacterium RIFCSPLOWO2_02_FULL_45_14]OGF93273.1 MAG: hypothetical protein A3G54_00810 [Candidatus Giovannonibacteria bacterium RIFCSPLOWO2_12_FULL_44_15]
MSNTLKTIIIGLAVIVLIGLGWKFYIDKNYSDIGLEESANVPAGVENQTASVSSGTSDAALDKDLLNIDAELNTLSSDSASIDQGLNDKPIPPAE